MSNDTISNSPEMLEEARRAAAQANYPKLPYDPKAIMREVWEEYKEPGLEYPDFDDFWKHAENATNSPHLDTAVFALKEHEYRQFASALVMLRTAEILANKAKSIGNEALAIREGCLLGLNRKAKQAGYEGKGGFIDVFAGMYRGSRQRVCSAHPNGCPEDETGLGALLGQVLGGGGTGNIIAVHGEEAKELGKALIEALGKKKQ